MKNIFSNEIFVYPELFKNSFLLFKDNSGHFFMLIKFSEKRGIMKIEDHIIIFMELQKYQYQAGNLTGTSS